MSGDHNMHQKETVCLDEPLKDEDIMQLWKECCMRVEGSSRELVLTFAHSIMARGGNGN